ncbi:hypothetical protein DNHGIG_20170 [Collibacillus ludicampi]|uniref:DUF7948 domain-containing protein n=1 Tax=Collibacillus ludicampi TaxID=2771369 RepID=A0AAV4LFM4_9BACL|nr:SBBP repeat-containing protein [Collibacillus ludicampi]GIM46468.1 hypothetical protein DNHGIG_20170 [Collibacillus ludicampi]
MPISEKSKQEIWENFRNLPLLFVPNVGQTNTRVHYFARGSRYGVYFTSEEVVFTFFPGTPRRCHGHPKRFPCNKTVSEEESSFHGIALALHFLNANPVVIPEGKHEGTGKVNYLIGNEPSKWHTNLSTYHEVVYQGLWKGVDLVFQGWNGQLKYTFVVQPGTHPDVIQLFYRGADDLSLDEMGNLQIQTPYGVLIDERPTSYQIRDGQQVEVTSSFVVKQYMTDEKVYSFQVGNDYDPQYPLIIDPDLVYSTYLGGSGSDEGSGIAVDSDGNAYITGSTSSLDFPVTPGVFSFTYRGGISDAFVTKLNSTGTALIYSTYLGGSRFDAGLDIAVDASGNAYVTGSTESSDFPTTPGAFQTTLAGGSDVFVTKLNSSGTALIYSTYLGGSLDDDGFDIAVDPLRNAYVTGSTQSLNFPHTPGAFQTTLAGEYDVFVTKLNPSGSTLVYSTFLGGSGEDESFGITVDAFGNAYVTGSTDSLNFPTTPGALFTTYRGGHTDAFVTKLNSSGTALVYSTYLGGSGYDRGTDIAVDSSGNAYITGDTDSLNFPTTPQAFQTVHAGFDDAFVTKLNSTGSALVYSTYLGGSHFDTGWSISIDSLRNVYVTGDTNSPDFPTTLHAFQTAHADLDDAFVIKLNPMGTMLYSTYLGGSGDDEGFGIAIDASGNAYITGDTNSLNFPSTPSAFQIVNAGGFDAFVTKIRIPTFSCPSVLCEFDASNPKRTTCIVNGTIVDVALVPFQFVACVVLTIRDDTLGIPLCVEPVVVTFNEDVALCLPDPLGNENIVCRILDVLCNAKLVPFDQSILLNITLCKEIQVEADVKLQVPARFCSPRRLISCVVPTMSPTCPPFLFPPQCPSLFPVPTVAPTFAPTLAPTAIPTPIPTLTPAPAPTAPVLELECIHIRKVYDWIFDTNTYTNKITLPEACVRTIQEALQAGHRISVSCATST